MNELRAKVLWKLAAGFFAGIGFFAAIAAAFFVVVQLDTPSRGGAKFKQYPRDGGLTIVDHHPLRRGVQTAFVGTLENRSKDEWQGIVLTAEMFDRGNHFLDKCSGTEYQKLAAGETRNFKIACDAAPEFDHYTIAVETATSGPPDGD